MNTIPERYRGVAPERRLNADGGEQTRFRCLRCKRVGAWYTDNLDAMHSGERHISMHQGQDRAAEGHS